MYQHRYKNMRNVGQYKKVITATPSQLESIIRLSEALAKMELSDVVQRKHVEEGIRLMQVATQSTVTDPVTGLIDMDMLNTGQTAANREKMLLLKQHIREQLVY